MILCPMLGPAFNHGYAGKLFGNLLDASIVVSVGRAGARYFGLLVLGLPSGEESKGEVSSEWVFSCPHLI